MTTWRLGVIEIPAPTEFRVDPLSIERSRRTASGLKVKDVIAVKKQFTLTYEFLNVSELTTFVDAYNAGEFTDFTYYERGESRTAVVEITECTQDMMYADPELWKNLQFVLEEQ